MEVVKVILVMVATLLEEEAMVIQVVAAYMVMEVLMDTVNLEADREA